MNFTNREKQLLLSNAPVLSRIKLYDENGVLLQIFNENDYLIDWEYEDYRYVPEQGFIGQFVERLLDGNLINIPENISLENKEVEMEIAVIDPLLQNQVYHSYGRFIITKIEQEDTTGNYHFETSDYTKKFNVPFNGNEVTYPCVALQLLGSASEQAGVSLDTNDTCGVYITPEEGLPAGNYCFYYDDIYYEFTLENDLVHNNVIMVYPEHIRLTTVDSEFNVTRTDIPYEESDDSDYELLVATPTPYYDFINNDFVIENNQFEENDSCRNVVTAIAKLGYTWARVNENNRLCLDFSAKDEEDVDTYDEIDTDKYYEATTTGDALIPINKVLIGMSNVEGENIVKSQDSDIMAIKKIYGETSQETYTGKNLLQLYTPRSETKNGVTCSISEDGTITLNGTATARADFIMYYALQTTANQAYTLNIIYISGSSTGTIGIFNEDGNHSWQGWDREGTITENVKVTHTFNYDMNLTTRPIRVYNGVTYNNLKFQVQFTQGSTADYNYEKYVGGIPSPNPDYPQNINNVSGDSTIKITGKSVLKQVDSFNIDNPASLGLLAGETSSRNGMILVRKEDQSIDVSGRTTGDPAQIVLGIGKAGTQTWNYTNGYILPQGTYKVVWELSNSSNIIIGVWKYDKNNAYAGFQSIKANSNTDTNGVGVITVDGETATAIGINCSAPNVDVVSTNVKLMVIKDSETNYTYEPYNDATYSIDLPVENLFDFSQYYNNRSSITSNVGNIALTENSITYSGYTGFDSQFYTSHIASNKSIYGMDNLKPNTTYTLSYEADGNTQSWLFFFDSSNTRTQVYQVNTTKKVSMTFTTPANLSWYTVRIDNRSGATNTITNIQVEQGSKANTYTPYGTTPIELNKIGTYQDYIYKENDKWYLKKTIGKVVLDGSESGWGKSGNPNNISYYYSGLASTSSYKFKDINTSIMGTTSSTNIYPAYSNYFKFIQGNQIFTDIVGAIFDYISNTQTIELRLGFGVNSEINTVDKLKTWLSTHNTIVEYPLATPEYQTITYQPLIDQLNALQNAGLFEGTNHITIDTLNEVPTVDITVINLEQDSTSYSGKSFKITGHDYSNGSQINIYDNPLTYTEDLRRIAINGAESLFGLTYTPMEIKSIGHPWLDGDEYIKVTNLEEDELYFYPFNRKINYSGVLTTDLSSQAKNEVQQKYENKDTVINRLNHTEIVVDKANQQVNMMAQQVRDNTSNITEMQINVNGITQTVSNIEENEITGIQSEISSIQQTVQSIQNLFTLQGGNNLVRNSAFLLTDEVWEFTDNGSNPEHTNLGSSYSIEMSGKTVSISEIKLQDTIVNSTNTNITGLKNDGTVYTLSFYYQQDDDTETTIRLYDTNDNTNKAFNDIVITGEKEFQLYSISFTPTATDYTLEIETSTNAASGYFYLYDLILNSGEQIPWQPASDEIYSTTLTMSRLGLTIWSVGDGTLTTLGSDGLVSYETTDGKTKGKLVSKRTVNGDKTRSVDTERIMLSQDMTVANAPRWVKTTILVNNNLMEVEYLRESGEQ